MPEYRKVAVGNLIAIAIKIPTMREKCFHFNRWVNRLECLKGLEIKFLLACL